MYPFDPKQKLARRGRRASTGVRKVSRVNGGGVLTPLFHQSYDSLDLTLENVLANPPGSLSLEPERASAHEVVGFHQYDDATLWTRSVPVSLGPRSDVEV